MKTFTTENQNHYCHSENKNQFLLLHPVMSKVVELKKAKLTDSEIFKSIVNKKINHRNHPISITKQMAAYYIDKAELWEQTGYFSALDNKKRLSGRPNAEVIEYFLANPKQIVFEVTDTCNLKCEYCGYGKFYTDYDERNNSNLNWETGKNLLNYIMNKMESPLNSSVHKKLTLSFYGGEPLLNMPFIKKMVSYSQSHYPQVKFDFSMTTNGMLLDKHIDFLQQNDFTVLVSLDGNKENNSYRTTQSNKNSFDTIVKNLEWIEKEYPEYFKSKISFNSVLHDRNSVDSIYSFFKTKFNKNPMISSLNTNHIVPSRIEEFRKIFNSVTSSFNSSNRKNELEENLFSRLPSTRNLSDTILFKSGYFWQELDGPLTSRENEIFYPTGTCIPFSKKIFITVNGKILPCERIFQNNPFGMADNSTVSVDVKKIIGYINSRYDQLEKRCTTCAKSTNCPECVFNLEEYKGKISCQSYEQKDQDTTEFSESFSSLEEHPDYYKKILKEVYLD